MLRDDILRNFGPDVSIAFYDPKPFFWLWNRDQVKYAELDGTRDYQILVLGVNEEMPEKVLQGAYKFNYSNSIYINGLEYWKIYVRGSPKKY